MYISLSIYNTSGVVVQVEADFSCVHGVSD